jgi:hypothetical protein
MELPQKRKLKHFAKLKSVAERLRKVLREFDDLGKPGWLLLRRGAELHEDESKQRLAELRLKRRSLEEQNRNSVGGQAMQAVNAQLSWHENVLSAYRDLGETGILFKAKIAAEAIIQWCDLPQQKMPQQEIDRLLASSSDQQDHINAVRSLMENLAEIYRNHFHRRFSLSRPPGGGELGGPAMRFTRAVFTEFQIVNEDGNSFSPEGIRRYWPTKP